MDFTFKGSTQETAARIDKVLQSGGPDGGFSLPPMAGTGRPGP